MNTPLDTKAIRVVAEAASPDAYRDVNGSPLLDWTGDIDVNDDLSCPACGRGNGEGHSDDCAAVAAFGACMSAGVVIREHAAQYLLTLCDELDELRATLANERGEGEPPGEGWEPRLEGERHDNDDGSEDIVTRWFKPLPGLWLYAGTSAAEHGWWWSVLGRTSEGRWVCMARGNAPTAREAMRSAMNAADKTRSPA